jgi:hypothetical protein
MVMAGLLASSVFVLLLFAIYLATVAACVIKQWLQEMFDQ